MDNEVAELRGRVMVLEKLLTDTLLKEIVEVKLRSINAETTAIRSAEVVQQMISEMGAPAVSETEDAAPGFFDVRGGAGRRRETKESLDEPS